MGYEIIYLLIIIINPNLKYFEIIMIFHRMIDIHKYDNMHRNEIFYVLICINNHVLSCLISMLSISARRLRDGEEGEGN